MDVFIYSLSDPRNDEIRYVGKSVNVYKRFNSHIWEDKRTDRKTQWVKSLKKLGLIPRIEILEIIQDSDDHDWQEKERFWISYLRFIGCRLTNIEVGGRGGGRPSPETIAKRTAKTIGQKRSDESKEKMRLAKLGRKASAETKSKMSAIRTGKKLRPFSAEARANMSKAHLGIKMPPFTAEHKARIGAKNSIKMKEFWAKKKALLQTV